MIFWGILMITIGTIMFYFQVKKIFFYKKEKRKDFLISPGQSSFWAIEVSLIIVGIILILQS